MKYAILIVGLVGLATGGCSHYAIKSESIRPAAVRDQSAPIRVAVQIPDTSELGRAVAGAILEDIYLDFVEQLASARVFQRVDQVRFRSSGQDRFPALTNAVITLVYLVDRSGGVSRAFNEFFTGLSLYLLAPVLESHETFTLRATAAMLGTTLRYEKDYTATGSATLTSKTNAPREQAVREAFLAAGRAANAKLVDQFVKEDYGTAWKR